MTTKPPRTPATPEPSKTPDSGLPVKSGTEKADAEFDTTTADAADGDKEVGGRRDGLDPTRYGDWEKNGRCIDF